MYWIIRTYQSSIGKKLMMALTGLSFCGFLAVHFIGNLYLYVGKTSFNGYVEHLHGLGPLIIITELGLLGFLVLHVGTALLLFIENLMARKVRYVVNKTAGGRTWASRLMPYTGLYILLFVLIHLVTIKFADLTGRTLYDVVDIAFSNVFYIIFYMFTMAVVGFHISHGLWSALQTIGANHPKYMPGIYKLSLAYAIVIGLGFGIIPIFMAIV